MVYSNKYDNKSEEIYSLVNVLDSLLHSFLISFCLGLTEIFLYKLSALGMSSQLKRY